MQLSRPDGGFIEPAHELRSISFPSMQRQKRNDACPFPSSCLDSCTLFFSIKLFPHLPEYIYLETREKPKYTFIRIR